ncbi:MAG: hypothetical protein AMJ84_09980 [Acidithiobacillales bacterium SM23_46]|nr:MAG: hypothetical protein AMJ84_09980 [Acidithiobacillales bacterium SM23_46]
MITGNPLRGKIDYTPELEGFEPRVVQLRTSDGLRLEAWEFYREPAPLTFVLAHGWGASKEMLDQQIVFLCREGWDVVAFDSRNHGNSEGRVSSVGYHETRDLEAAVAHVRSGTHLGQTVFLWGISMGAVAAIRVAERDPSIRGLIAESSYLSLRETVWHHVRLYFGFPLTVLAPLVLAWVRWRARFNTDDLDVARSVGRITQTSAMFVASEEDRRTPPATARRLAELCAGPHTRVFIAPHGEHACIFADNQVAYANEVRRFVGEALERGERSPFAPTCGGNAADRPARRSKAIEADQSADR